MAGSSSPRRNSDPDPSEPPGEALWSRARRQLQAYFASRADPDDAEDLVQQTLREAFEKIHTFDPRRGNLHKWVQGYAKNVWGRYCRDSSRDREVLIDTSPADGEPMGSHDVELQVMGRPERQRSILGAFLHDLPLREYQVVIACGLERQPVAEVAAYLGLTPSTVRSHLQSARERFEADLVRLWKTAGEDHDVSELRHWLESALRRAGET